MPAHFVLYGGTAIALRLGGRQSVDFDFFSSDPLQADRLAAEVEFLKGATLIQSAPETASWLVPCQGGEVKVSCFGGLTIGRVGTPEPATDNGILIASLHDLAAQKVKVVQVRAEAKDYLDLHTLMEAGISLAEAIGSASALYPQFPVLPTLKALSYFGDGDLHTLPAAVKQRLASVAAEFTLPTPMPRASAFLN
jgi:hypothetical protein